MTKALDLNRNAVDHTQNLDAEAGVISDGSSFKEGDSALFALVGHDLDESDAQGIIDADMEEPPGGAEMAVDSARISPGDGVSQMLALIGGAPVLSVSRY
ncbi:hypothetical protein NKJ06_33535 [Mesorhizobium sp. M0293]|uniref:hypothetical protein n=1 Tax=Mesorhizobium sp. M0293 TaxID=2956930 RepID=UPI00333AA75E